MHKYCIVFFVLFLSIVQTAFSDKIDVTTQLQNVVQTTTISQIKVQEDITSLLRDIHKAKVLPEQADDLRKEAKTAAESIPPNLELAEKKSKEAQKLREEANKIVDATNDRAQGYIHMFEVVDSAGKIADEEEERAHTLTSKEKYSEALQAQRVAEGIRANIDIIVNSPIYQIAAAQLQYNGHKAEPSNGNGAISLLPQKSRLELEIEKFLTERETQPLSEFEAEVVQHDSLTAKVEIDLPGALTKEQDNARTNREYAKTAANLSVQLGKNEDYGGAEKQKQKSIEFTEIAAGHDQKALSLEAEMITLKDNLRKSLDKINEHKSLEKRAKVEMERLTKESENASERMDFTTAKLYAVHREAYKALLDRFPNTSVGKYTAKKKAEAAKKKAEKEAEAAKKKAEKEAEAAKKKAEKEAEAAKKKAEKEAEAAKKKAEKEAEAARKKTEKEAEEVKIKFSPIGVVLVSYAFVSLLRGVGVLSVYKVISVVVEIYCVKRWVASIYVPIYGMEVTSAAATVLFTILVWLRNKRSNIGITFAVGLWYFPVLGPIIGTVLNGHISDWDVSGVTNMMELFKDKKEFNDDISGWDTSNVTDMSYMFYGDREFNQPLDKWDTSNVTNMSYMFYKAVFFRPPLDKWDTSNVTNMSYMFYEAHFPFPLDKWDTSNVTDMSHMFAKGGLTTTPAREYEWMRKLNDGNQIAFYIILYFFFFFFGNFWLFVDAIYYIIL